jgi:acetoin:2,6-dichlorophenolindophenol oxidoreductase subunit beta
MIVGELNAALRRILSEDERVMILGEDLADPYGGAFKVTKGLSTLAPDRVLSTPVSEGAIVGIAAGLALEGYRPIVEVMFADFLTLTFDQVMNHITKYPAMYDHKVTCPVIIRSPAGGHRGYGPTHSQSPEKHFLGVPNLLVVALSPYHHPFEIYRQLLRRDEAVLFVEHKLLYPQPLTEPADGRIGLALAREHVTPTTLPTVSLSWVPPEQCTTTVLAYGYSAFLAARVLEQLAIEDEIFAELVVPAQIAPLDLDPIQASLERTGSLVTIEEGTAGWSWGTEVAAQLGRRQFGRLRRPIDVVASEPAIIPARTDHEGRMLVGAEHIRRAVREAAA